MKHYTSYSRQPMYPGAADTSYFTRKAKEILCSILSGTGAFAVMLLLMTMA